MTATSDRCSVRYEFRRDGITLTLANTSAKALIWYMIIDPRATAADGGQGLVKTPITNQPWQSSTWISGGSRLAIAGTNRVWEWVERTCAVQTDLEPGQTRQLTLSLGKASADEQKQAAAVAGH